MGYAIYNADGERVRFYPDIETARAVCRYIKNGYIRKLVALDGLPRASKKRFAIYDLRHKKYVSIA